MAGRRQAAAIPFRRRKDTIELCLIRRKGATTWKIPKGFVERGETVKQAALKEAWEEAGLEGRLIGETIGSYKYRKWGVDLPVAVYVMEVRDWLKDWDESRFRERSWTPLDKAFKLLRKHPVEPLLDKARTKIERRRAR